MYWTKKQRGVTCVKLSSLNLGEKACYFEVKHAERILKDSYKNGGTWRLNDDSYELSDNFTLKKINNAAISKRNNGKDRKPDKQETNK